MTASNRIGLFFLTLRRCLIQQTARMLAPQRGQGLAEYAIVLALIAVVVVGAVTLLGEAVVGVFEDITSELDGIGAGGTP
jgi:pilus assembly protein Flp/PilA